MILVDTSVWIDHLSRGSDLLRKLLLDQEVLVHPFVAGELSLGSIRNRSEVLGLLAQLPSAPVADHAEVVSLVEKKHLAGTGIGWIDAHLIASTMLANGKLLTTDRPLLKAIQSLGLGA